jgi:hypothetical protein
MFDILDPHKLMRSYHSPPHSQNAVRSSAKLILRRTEAENGDLESHTGPPK